MDWLFPVGGKASEAGWCGASVKHGGAWRILDAIGIWPGWMRRAPSKEAAS